MLGDQSVCTACPAGFMCPVKSNPPIVCAPGTFSIGSQALCTPVPAGFYTASAGMMSPVKCGVGQYASGGASVCSTCELGYRCPSGSTEPAPLSAACAIGGFCNPPGIYTLCLAGTYGIVEAGRR